METSRAPEVCLTDNTLAEFVDGVLDDEGKVALERHVAACGRCRRVLAEMARVNSVLRSVEGEVADAHATGSRDEIELESVDPKRYRVDRELAHGGMGRILEGWDRRHARKVAIKVLLRKGTAASWRFVREAAITASLQHPAIVPLYEAGRWTEGELFFAMKLVEGRSLEVAMGEARTLERRLALLGNLVAVSDALAYAHERRIVHRDLKPSNVLLGAYGETVVIDWGLAKRLDDEATTAAPRDDEPSALDHAEPAATLEGQALGTPCYMPPEQARGDRVDERADVYALGAMLYHLFAGRPPYSGATARETIARVLEGPPPPLARLAPEMPSDLKTLVEKAMARDPNDRYANAAELRADLLRFTTGRLVAAHAYSLAALLRRWVARHRAPLSVAAAFLLTLVVVSTLAVRRVVRERDRADDASRVAQQQRADAIAEREAAERLVDFTVDELRARLEAFGRLDLLAGVGTQIDRYYQATSAHASDTASLGRRASAFETLALVEERAHDAAAARGFFRASLDLRKKALESSPGDRALRMDLARTEVDLADFEYAQGDADASKAAADSAGSIAGEIATANPSDDDARLVAAKATIARAWALRDRVGVAAGLAEVGAAVDALESIAARTPNEVAVLRALGRAYYVRGVFDYQLGHLDTPALPKSVALREKLVRIDPANVPWQDDLAVSYLRLGAAELNLHAFDAALGHLRAAAKIAERLSDRDPANFDALQRLARAHDTLCSLFVEMKQLDDARAECMASVVVGRDVLARSATAKLAASDLVLSLERLGSIDESMKRLDDARSECAEALAIAKRARDDDPGSTNAQQVLAGAYGFLAEIDRSRGDLEAALASYQQAIDVYAAMPATAKTHDALRMEADFVLLAATVELRLGRLDAARDRYSAGMSAMESALGPKPAQWDEDVLVELASTAIDLAHALAARGDAPQTGKEMLNRAIALVETIAAVRPLSPPMAKALERLRAAAR